MSTATTRQTEANRETIRHAFEAWRNGTGREGKVIDGTAFYDSISFHELWSRVQPHWRRRSAVEVSLCGWTSSRARRALVAPRCGARGSG